MQHESLNVMLERLMPYRKSHLRTQLAVFALILLSLLSLSGCEQKAAVSQQQFLALGTLIDLSLYGADEQQTQLAMQKINARMESIHHNWHAWQPGRLTQINQQLHSGHSVQLNAQEAELIAQGIALAEQSEQRFNPAAGQLIALWGFHSDERPDAPPPAAEAIATLTTNPATMANLKLNGQQLSSTHANLQLDVGGYAKGYAVDEAINTLREMGINNAIVNAGGDLRAIGDKNGQAWRIGIRHPRKPGVIASIEVSGDESVFTSGDYERYFAYHDQRYHHILDPHSGYPAHGISSVTVVHPDATTADAAATALFIAGVHDWPRIAKRMGIELVMLIDDHGNIHMSQAMQARIHFEDDAPRKINITP